jgi:uncharacterized protein (TIGR02678 family)
MNESERDMLDENDSSWSDEVLETPSMIRHTARDVLLAHTLLLDNVVIAPHINQEAFRLVKVHIQALEQWHEQHTGWRVQRGAAFFRLERHMHMMQPVFVDDKLKEVRDFACLAWILWFAEKRYLAGSGKHQQFLLSHLTEQIQEQTRTISESGLDVRNMQDRYSMRRALEYLIEQGCLQMLEGEVKRWADSSNEQEHEILFEFTPLAHSLIVALNEKWVSALQASQQERAQIVSSQHLLAQAAEIPPLVRAWRTLLLGPALLRYDDAEAFHELTRQSERVQEELGATFGWSLELNRDYACVVRGGGVSIGAGAGISFNGAYDQVLLLLCGKFREQVQSQQWVPDAYGCIMVTQWQLLPLFSDLRQRYGAYWGATVQNVSAEHLLQEVYKRMRQVDLIRGPDREGSILILPTAARYSVHYQTLQETGGERRGRVQKKKEPLKKSPAQSNGSISSEAEE